MTLKTAFVGAEFKNLVLKLKKTPPSHEKLLIGS
jgi:hypothetical protein